MPLPATYVPDFYDSKLNMVAACLVNQGEVELSTLVESMGCPVEIPPPSPPVVEPELIPGTPFQSFDSAGDLAAMLAEEDIMNCELVLDFNSYAELNAYLAE